MMQLSDGQHMAVPPVCLCFCPAVPGAVRAHADIVTCLRRVLRTRLLYAGRW